MYRSLKKISMGAVVLACGFSSFAWGFDLSQADALYATRGGANEEGDTTAIEAAAKAYSDLITASQVQGDDLVYAVEQIARLRSYQIALTPATDKTKRIEIADLGLKSLEAISKLDVPQYYYWNALLTTRRAQSEGELSFAKYIQKVFSWIDAGDKIAPTYEGGGFKRLRGQILSKLPALIGGSPTKAESQFGAALKSEPYDKDRSEFKEYERGDMFYSLYYYRAENFCKGLKNKEEALKIFAEVKRLIDDEQISPKRIPETKLDIKQIKDLENEVNAGTCK